MKGRGGAGVHSQRGMINQLMNKCKIILAYRDERSAKHRLLNPMWATTIFNQTVGSFIARFSW
eukprot:COSAG06_NODE_3359_length_5457_cov_2.794700_2_plen_63_part_00